jgi:uncharacterized MAPEG superfamily protein
MIKRAGSAHANRVENLPVFAAAMVLAMATGVKSEVINRYGLMYSLASMAYSVAYVCIDREVYSLARTACWYVGVWATVRLFWEGGKRA